MDYTKQIQELRQTVDQLARNLTEVLVYIQERKIQQISEPLDEPSRNVLGAEIDIEGAGSTTKTQTYPVSGGAGGTITGPKAYVATRLFKDPDTGEVLEIPVIAINP